jgi:hypothetical protein
MEVSFGLTEMDLTGRCRFWPAWNVLECQKSILAPKEWLGIKEVVFGMTGMAWKEGSRSFRNSLEWRKSVLDCLL